MSDINENTDIKEDLIAKIREEKILYSAVEEENLKVSKSIADCQDALKEQEFEKLITRSDSKKKSLRKLAIYSKEIDNVMLEIETLKSQKLPLLPAQPIRTYTQKYQKLTDDMEKIVLNRSLTSIEERKQDLIYNLKKTAARVNETSKNNHVLKLLIRNGNWEVETKILNSLLQQARKQGQVIDDKDNLRHKRIQELQKRINKSKQNLNITNEKFENTI